MTKYRPFQLFAGLGVLAGLWHLDRAVTGAETVTVEIAGGGRDRPFVLASMEMPPSPGKYEDFALTRIDTGESIPVQREGGRSRRVWWIERAGLGAGEARRYRLTSAGGTPAAEGVRVEDDGKHLVVTVAGKPVLVYNHAMVPSPDPKQPYYARSGYIHPVYNPSGHVVTDDFNPDHMHQHGIMFAWTKSTFEGRPANCWDQKTGQGKVEHVAVLETGDGPVFGSFAVRLRHVNLNAPEGAKPMLDETWYVRVYNFTERFLFDLESNQTCAGRSPFVVEEYHYGGLMIRGAAAWPAGSGADFLTSDGKTRENGNHTRPRWCDIYGPLDGRTTGVTIMCHPGNRRFPQPVRLHPSMPYFCFAPAVLGSFRLEPDKPPYVSRYRFAVHDGAVDSQFTEHLWHDYAHPLEARVAAE
jgi:hypothetical protein